MKKLLTIFLTLTLVCVCLFGISTVVYAEELPNETATETVVEEPTEEESLTEIKAKLNALMAKYNSEIETGKNFFNTRISPAIISATIATLFNLIFSGRTRKSNKDYKNKYNQAATQYNALEKQYNELKAEKEKENQIYDGEMYQGGIDDNSEQAAELPSVSAGRSGSGNQGDGTAGISEADAETEN